MTACSASHGCDHSSRASLLTGATTFGPEDSQATLPLHLTTQADDYLAGDRAEPLNRWLLTAAGAARFRQVIVRDSF